MKLPKCVVLLVVIGLLTAACAPAPKPQVVEKVVTQVVEKERVVEKPAAAEPAAAPKPAEVAKSVGTPVPSAAGQSVSSIGDISLTEGRKIIKSGDMTLLVEDTDRAVDKVTEIAVLAGGYIISSQTTVKGGFKFATLNLGVPVERFEDVQRQLRAMALQVLSDTTSGKDVTEEYVDTQSKLTNLEATQARIREFLDRATTVEEALKVNAQLTEIEAQISQTKGRLNYLAGRSAFSTLNVNLEPQRPTPTPTPTATPTPTPTPAVWRPGETFREASSALGTLTRLLGDLLIWLVVVVLPFVVLVGLVIAFFVWLLRRLRPSRPPKASG
jgi:hypothetical protein